MQRSFFVLFIFFAIGIGNLPAKNVIAAKHPLVLKADSTKVHVKTFDEPVLNNYRSQQDFQYQDDDYSPSWWGRFWRWVWNVLSHLFNFSKTKHQSQSLLAVFLKYLGIVLGTGALIFLILKLAGIDAFNIFRRKAADAGLSYSESLENIHEINFDPEIEKAVTQHNYRLAVRLLYLKCLKQLSDATLINWQADKTNSIYINEISNPRRRDAFKALTFQFEYIWYGEFEIDGRLFKKIDEMFQQFKTEML